MLLLNSDQVVCSIEENPNKIKQETNIVRKKIIQTASLFLFTIIEAQ